MKFNLKLLQIKCHVLGFTTDKAQNVLQRIIRVFVEAFVSHDRHTLFALVVNRSWLFLTALWPSWCGLCWEPFFSGALDLFKSIDDCMKGCYMWTTWDTYSRGPYVDWAWKACCVVVGFPLQGVHRFKSPRLSDMNNRLFVSVFS
jgi:hypothetical protein